MAKWIFTRPGSWDYPTLGFRATTGDVCEADLAPDTWWDATDSGATVTVPIVPTAGIQEDLDGAVLVYNATTNKDERKLPAAAGLLTEASADARIAAAANKRRAGTSIVLMGDSLTAYNGGSSTGTPVQAFGALDGKGAHNWANVFLGHDLEVLGNSGIGGQESSQVAARFTTDVLDLAPAIVSILAGTNDEADDQTTFYLNQMYTAALNAGILVLAQTIPPSTSVTAGVEGYRLAVNEWIREKAATTPGIILADLAAAWQDPSLSGFKCKATYTHDGTHPNLMGAMVLGRVIADTLRPFVPSNRLRAAAAVAPYNMLSNPHFNGSGATDPSGWGVSGSGLTKSYAARADGMSGQYFQVVVPAGGWVNLTSNVTVDGSALAVGDAVEFLCEVEVSGHETGSPASRNMYAYIQQYNGSAFSDKSFDVYRDGGTSYGLSAVVPDGTKMAFRCPPVAVTSGKTLVQVVLSLNGGGTYKIKGAALRNVTKIEAASVAP